jgi:hypothetical protein
MARLTNLGILGASVLIGFLAVEFASRHIMPISPGARLVEMDGTPLTGLQIDYFRYKPNLRYRQVSFEYDVITTIDKYGNRVPSPPENPDVLFVGDSFTFGHGLKDEDTFVSIYCGSLDVSCANLGRPGIGTTKELNILEYYLFNYGWRPKVVKLFMVAMSGSLMSGNDLYDNYLAEQRNAFVPTAQVIQNKPAKHTSKPAAEDEIRKYLKYFKNGVLEHSNLGRFVYFSLGHYIRTIFSPPVTKEILETGLRVTMTQLDRLEQISRKYSFRTEVFVIHPIQDLIRGTSSETMELLAETAPDTVFVSSAEIYEEKPEQYYLSYDGHWNAKGAMQFANFLVARDKAGLK